MENQEIQHLQLGDLIGETTTVEQYEDLISHKIPKNAQDFWGGKAKEILIDLVISVCAFPGPPASFPKEAMEFVLGAENDKELNVMIDSLIELGIMKKGEGTDPTQDAIIERTKESDKKLNLNLPLPPAISYEGRFLLASEKLRSDLRSLNDKYQQQAK